MDWQVGDLAVCVGRNPNAPGYWTCKGGPPKGTALVVDGVQFGYSPSYGPWTALVFSGYPSVHFTRGWHAESYRKVVPDKQEACEPEFVTLIKRAKRPVSA
jgi:hypothetical protein